MPGYFMNRHSFSFKDIIGLASVVWVLLFSVPGGVRANRVEVEESGQQMQQEEEGPVCRAPVLPAGETVSLVPGQMIRLAGQDEGRPTSLNNQGYYYGEGSPLLDPTVFSRRNLTR